MNNSKIIISNWDKLPVALSLETVCLVFDINYNTGKKWVKDGTIQGAKIGHKWYFDKEYIKDTISLKNTDINKINDTKGVQKYV